MRMMRPLTPLAVALGLSVAIGACGDDDDKKADTTATTDATTATDATAATDAAPETAEETAATETTDDAVDTNDGSTEPAPDHFPAKATPADENIALPDLTDPVRVVYDDRGIPHIYGANELDVFMVQGYVTARDRLFQMHTLRSAAKGRLAEFAGVSNLSGDFFLRLLKLGRTAEAMAAWTEDNDPALWAALQAFTKGVNTYIARMRAGDVPKPLEVALFGDQIVYDWSPADTMAVVRLQTWDLGFGGAYDEITLWNQIQDQAERFAGTNLDGVWLDYANFEPPVETATLEPDGGASQAGSYDLAAALQNDFFGIGKKKRRAWVDRVKKGLDEMKSIPHHAFRGEDSEGGWGSNNWVVSGAHTASGKPIVSNDTHLSLRNPAVFYQVHVSTKLAGGALDAEGVNFAGAPGITLGHNGFAAWGGTVHYTDVTDVYVETLNAAKTSVRYDGADVALVAREETFRFPASDAACIDGAPAWAKNLAYTESKDAGVCTLVVTFLDVPHHGPIVPWSIEANDDGTFTAMSYRWTGFDATDELGAVYRLNTTASWDGFKAALDRFGVGAQNWIYGDTDGNIGWYPSHLMPVRKHIAAGDYAYPPFLPMPGDTSDTNWDGFVPREDLPQAYNPARGWLVTANGDPIGVSFDNDPFNDGPYIGYAWDNGFRADRATELVKGLVDGPTPLTREHMKAVQADHRSPLGAAFVPVILEALDDAADDATASPLLTAQVTAAIPLLTAWGAEHDFMAASGVGAAAGSDEAEAAAATAIFNAWLPFFLKNTLTDEGLAGANIRFIHRLLVRPETMVTYDDAGQVSPLWDDITTAGVTETRAFIITKSLGEALAFLANPEKVGPTQAGGFGTADMTQWRWGALHTVTLRHNLTAAFNIPAPTSAHPNGYERHGDNYVLDASHPGLGDTSFTFSGGAAIRNHYEMTVPVQFDGVIPGGQSEDPNNPSHYSDEAELWAQNLSPKIVFAVDDVVSAKEKIVDFRAP